MRTQISYRIIYIPRNYYRLQLKNVGYVKGVSTRIRRRMIDYNVVNLCTTPAQRVAFF